MLGIKAGLAGLASQSSNNFSRDIKDGVDDGGCEDESSSAVNYDAEESSQLRFAAVVGKRVDQGDDAAVPEERRGGRIQVVVPTFHLSDSRRDAYVRYVRVYVRLQIRLLTPK